MYRSRLRLFGHPIHPMLVGFPVAFYTGTLVAFIVFAAVGGLFWQKMAIALNVAGVAMAIVAALPGFVDWAFGIPARTPAFRTGLVHLGLNVAALAVFAVCLGTYLGDWSGPEVGATRGIVLSAVGVVLTILAGFQGWKLVQDHHVGVRMLEEAGPEERERLRRVS